MFDFFLAHRVAVFPINGKVPAVPKGTNWADWDDFIRPRPTGAYGVVLGSLLVVDTDHPETEAWAQAHLPPTPFRVTPSRGVHRYYRAPSVLTPAFIRHDGLAIEARRQGQYVVGPGSVHQSGAVYTPTDWSWRWDDLPVFPADFDFGQPASTGYGEPYTPPREIFLGERHHELFRLIRHLKALDNDRAFTRYVVELFNVTRCVRPIDLDEGGWFGRSWNHTDRPGFKRQLSALFTEDGL